MQSVTLNYRHTCTPDRHSTSQPLCCQGVLQVGPSLVDGGPPSNCTQMARPSGHTTVVVFQMHAGDNCRHCNLSPTLPTNDDRPNITPASSQHGAKRRAGLYCLLNTRVVRRERCLAKPCTDVIGDINRPLIFHYFCTNNVPFATGNKHTANDVKF